MASTHSHGQSQEVRNPGPHQISSGLRTAFIAFAVIGAGSFAFGWFKHDKMAWISLLHNHFYFLSLALGGLFFAAIQWLTNAMWSAPIRRVSESFTAYLPFVAVSSVLLFFGLHELYVWTHEDHVKASQVLMHKSSYLNETFFIIRNLVAVGLWAFFGWKLIGNSLAQDKSKDARLSKRNASLAPIFLLTFAFSFTMASFDQLMSLDPHWFSTMYGVYTFAGLFYSSLALICLVTLYLRSQGKLEGIVNVNHLHDIGKFMFAFTVFWAYIAFSQFMLIWYANLPEETGYYIKRFDGSWYYVSVFLLVGKFMVPFFLLLPRDMKRNAARLGAVAVFMLISQWIDMMWLIQPEFFRAGPAISLTYIGVTLGFVGVFGLLVSRFLARNNVVAIGDPRLVESVFHHHQ